jgi:hypothetical protein
MRWRTDSFSREIECMRVQSAAVASTVAQSQAASRAGPPAAATRTVARSGTKAEAAAGVALHARAGASMSSAAFLKRSYSCRRRTSLGARVALDAFSSSGARQQHARLDLGQDRGHHQVLGGQLEAQVLQHVDVVDVLAGDLRDRDVEDVQVLPADQVQQQVERALEGLEDDLERIRRDVQVLRHLQHRLALEHGQRHLLLLGRRRWKYASGRALRVWDRSSDIWWDA